MEKIEVTAHVGGNGWGIEQAVAHALHMIEERGIAQVIRLEVERAIETAGGHAVMWEVTVEGR